MTRITWKWGDPNEQWLARGRNGYFYQHGMAVSTLGESSDIVLRAITSRGVISDSARLVVPRTQLPDLIRTLQSMQEAA